MTKNKTKVIFTENNLVIEVTDGEITSRVEQTKDYIKVHVPSGKLKLNKEEVNNDK